MSKMYQRYFVMSSFFVERFKTKIETGVDHVSIFLSQEA